MWQIAFPVSNLVARHRGTLPVLITCPHGGTADVTGVLPRSGNTTPAGCNFERDRDVDTIEVAAGVAQRMLEIFGEAPYVVIAQYHRKFLDANRSRICAFEDPDAAPFYDEYHNTVRTFVDEIRTHNGGLGLLFDIHGTAGIPGDPAVIFLGTANGEDRRPAAGGRSASAVAPSQPAQLPRGCRPCGLAEAAGRTGNACAQRRLYRANLRQLACRRPRCDASGDYEPAANQSRPAPVVDRSPGVCVRQSREPLCRFAHLDRGRHLSQRRVAVLTRDTGGTMATVSITSNEGAPRVCIRGAGGGRHEPGVHAAKGRRDRSEPLNPSRAFCWSSPPGCVANRRLTHQRHRGEKCSLVRAR